MADFSKPDVDSNKVGLLSEVRNNIEAVATWFRSGSHSNIPTGALRLESTTKAIQSWSGSEWEHVGYLNDTSNAGAAASQAAQAAAAAAQAANNIDASQVNSGKLSGERLPMLTSTGIPAERKNATTGLFSDSQLRWNHLLRRKKVGTWNVPLRMGTSVDPIATSTETSFDLYTSNLQDSLVELEIYFTNQNNSIASGIITMFLLNDKDNSRATFYYKNIFFRGDRTAPDDGGTRQTVVGHQGGTVIGTTETPFYIRSGDADATSGELNSASGYFSIQFIGGATPTYRIKSYGKYRMSYSAREYA